MSAILFVDKQNSSKLSKKLLQHYFHCAQFSNCLNIERIMSREEKDPGKDPQQAKATEEEGYNVPEPPQFLIREENNWPASPEYWGPFPKDYGK